MSRFWGADQSAVRFSGIFIRSTPPSADRATERACAPTKYTTNRPNLHLHSSEDPLGLARFCTRPLPGALLQRILIRILEVEKEYYRLGKK